MIAKMRDMAPVVMWIVIAAFVGTIFFAWGMDFSGGSQKPTVGEISGKDIPLDYFDRMVTMERQRLQYSSQGEVPPQQNRMIPRRIWEQQVQRALMSDVFARMKLGATEDEIFEHLKNNPPPGIDTAAYFQTNGRFDTSKYVAFLNRPETYNDPGMRELEMYTHEFIVPTKKLEALLTAGVIPTREEVARRYREKEERAVFEFAHLSLSAVSVDSETIDLPQIEAYYKSNQERFESDEQAELYYIRLPKVASASDTVMYREQLLDIKKRVAAGEAGFADEATLESDDPGSAAKGGDLGWFGRGTMVPAFEEAAFNAAEGDLVGPVQSPFGYHLILVEDTRTTEGKKEIKARHILRKIEASVETFDSLKALADSLITVARERGIKDAAEAVGGVTVDSTGLFERGEDIPGIGFISGLIRFAFTDGEPGAVPEFPFDNRKAFYVFQLKRRLEAGIQPVAEVEREIRKMLLDTLIFARAEERLEKALKSRGEDEGLAAAFGEDTAITTGVTDTVTMTQFIPTVGYQNRAVVAAFTLPLKKRSKVIRVPNGVCVVYPVWRKEITDISWESPEVAVVQQQLIREYRNRVYYSWFEHLKNETNVVSRVDEYYE